MRKSKYKFIIPGLALLVVGYSCGNKFLTKPPLGALQQTQLANEAGVKSLLIGAYSLLDGEGNYTQGNQYGSGASNWVYGSVCADDAYKGSTPSDQGDIVAISTWQTATAANSYPNQRWIALYDGVNRANDVIRTMALASDIKAADHGELMAEARFLRGFYHFEAKKMWKNIPYADETISYNNNNLSNASNAADAWPKIEADFTFAMDSLPAKQTDIGRANKYAAEAFLLKCYMFEHRYTDAKPLLTDLLANGVTSAGTPYGFNPNGYFNNFNPDPSAKNSSEVIFSVQTSVNDGSGTNGNYGDVLNFPNDGSGPGGCCGFDNPSINLANAYKTDATGLPLLDNFNTTGANVIDSSYAGTLDPRVDFVLGRPGIPYLDWGHHPGSLWVRDGTDGYFSPKKNVYAKSQKGTLSSNETSFWGPTQIVANNINIIRYSDLLLWAAEIEVETGGSLTTAMGYVNQVRNRIATHPETWTYDDGFGHASSFKASTYQYGTQTKLAANYLIKPYTSFPDANYAMKAIRFERRLELAEEGHRFFDLQRWDSDATYPEDMSAILNAYQSVEKTRPSIWSVNPTATFHKGVNEIFPIPQTQIDLENAKGTVVLKQNPGYN